MRRRSSLVQLAVAATATFALVPATDTMAQVPTLAFGTPVSGTTGPRGQAVKYHITADAAGVLAVAANGGADLTLAVTTDDGEVLRDGTADVDFRGQTGLEYLAVVIPRAGRYVVEVRTNGDTGGIAFRVVATFAPMPAFELPVDPDGSPSRARAITVGTAQQDRLHPDEGDLADWYTLTATEAMTLTIATRVDDGSVGDLVIEAFVGDDLSAAAARSDQDLRGNAGNESVTVDLKAGERVRIRIGSVGGSGGEAAYRLSVGKMP